MLYYITYGCSCESTSLIVEAKNEQDACDYAYLSAQESYSSYSYNDFDPIDYEEYATEEEMWDMFYEEMENDIHYSAERYNEHDEDHTMTYGDQNFEAFRIS